MSYVKHINQLIESNRQNDPVGEKEFAHTAWTKLDLSEQNLNFDLFSTKINRMNWEDFG